MGLKGYLRESFNANSGGGFGIGYERGDRLDRGPRVRNPTGHIRSTIHAWGELIEGVVDGGRDIATGEFDIRTGRHRDGSPAGHHHDHRRSGLDPRDAGHRYTGGGLFGSRPTFTVGQSGAVYWSDGRVTNVPEGSSVQPTTEAQIAEVRRTAGERSDPRSEALRRSVQGDANPPQASDEEVETSEDTEVEDPASKADEVAADANAAPPPPPPPPTAEHERRENERLKREAEEAERKKAVASQPSTSAPLVTAPAAPLAETNPDESFAHLSVAISNGIQPTDKLFNQFSSQGYKMMPYGQGDNITYVAMRDGKVYGAIAPVAGDREQGQSIDNDVLEARLQKSGQSIEKIEYAAQSVNAKLLAEQSKPDSSPAPEAPKQTVSLEAKGGITI